MAQTLWEVVGAVADRRGRKGRQFPLQAVLAIAIAAMLAGANDLRAIFRWGRRLKRRRWHCSASSVRRAMPPISTSCARSTAMPWHGRSAALRAGRASPGISPSTARR
jgi:DDE_Tnp_1-associated